MKALAVSLALLIAAPAAAEDVGFSVQIGQDGSRTLVHKVVVAAPIEQVWHAVATPEGWQEWAVPLTRTIAGSDRFETSYDPAAAPGAGNTIEQQWVARTEPYTVVYRTTRTPSGFPDGENYLKVTSAFALKSLGPGETEVTHTSAGFASDEAGDRLLVFFTEGNRLTLEQLRERFASGPVDWSAKD